jgi:uncharacterized membrane protein YedE/YeeE
MGVGLLVGTACGLKLLLWAMDRLQWGVRSPIPWPRFPWSRYAPLLGWLVAVVLLAVPPRFWFGSLVGGLLFGLGMVLAGGCASGVLWRAAEGHLKLWVALLTMAWSGSTLSALARPLLEARLGVDLLIHSALGSQQSLPADLGGWLPATALTLALISLLWWLVSYNQRHHCFSLFRNV